MIYKIRIILDAQEDIFRDLEVDDMQKSRGYCQREYVSPIHMPLPPFALLRGQPS